VKIRARILLEAEFVAPGPVLAKPDAALRRSSGKMPFEQEGEHVSRTGWLVVLILMWLGLANAAVQQSSDSERRTARHFDSIRQQPSLLLAFLREMPKGGDLHNHLFGAVYAESLIDFAARDNFCVDRTTSVLIAPPCDDGCARYASKPSMACAYQDHVLYNSIVDAWSMRNWAGEEPGHDHFFATFDKFQLALFNHLGDALAEVAARAAADHLQYLELMHTADGMQSAALGEKLGWDDDFARLRERLLAGGLKEVVTSTRQQLDRDEASMRQLLRCGSPQPDPGCAIEVRYLYQVLRGLPRQQVFAQMLLGFELAQVEPRFVGLNLVMPEDWYVPMHDFDLHMKMLDYLHGVYPKVHISLHAGEFAMGLVPPEGLAFHIRQSIGPGHAERIGHGTSVMNERDALGLLREMARRKVLVEICLTSEDVILGVHGTQHPLPAYLRYGVPVALATDDPGVARSDMTHEYLRAAEAYGLGYSDLKAMARRSLEHAFLDAHDRVRAQQRLEQLFREFESRY
jgi:adenosine deaminase